MKVLTNFAREGSSYMLGRALTSVLWGAISDRYGRKPVIIIGCAAMLVIKFISLKILSTFVYYFLINGGYLF